MSKCDIAYMWSKQFLKLKFYKFMHFLKSYLCMLFLHVRVILCLILKTHLNYLGYNEEIKDYKDMRFTICDVGGQSKFKTLWRHYFIKAKAVIFVIDTADVKRFDEARDLLQVAS